MCMDINMDITTNTTTGLLSNLLNNTQLYKARILFYALVPREASYEKLDQVPDYIAIVSIVDIM